MAVQVRVVETDATLQVNLRGDEPATVKHGHRHRSMCLDQIARLLARLLRRFVTLPSFRKFQEVYAQIMGFCQVGPDEMAHPKSPGRREDFLFVVELLTKLQHPNIVFFHLLHRVALACDQDGSQPNAKRQLYFIAVPHLGVALNNLEPTPQVTYRLEGGPGFRGSLASLQPEIDSGFALVRFGKVMSQQLGLAIGPLRVHFSKHRRDLRMQLLSIAMQQARMSRILYHHVLERVDRFRRVAAADNQASFLKMTQRRSKLVRRRIRDGAEYLIGELAANGGPYLCGYAGGPHAIETSHQRVGQGGWNRKLAQRASEHVASVLLAEKVRFEHGFGQFLDKQRHPVGLDSDLLDDLVGKLLGARNTLDQRRPQLAAKPV